MFTETVTISLERYEELKRFDNMQNNQKLYLVKGIESAVLNLGTACSKEEIRSLHQAIFRICNELKGYEEK